MKRLSTLILLIYLSVQTCCFMGCAKDEDVFDTAGEDIKIQETSEESRSGQSGSDSDSEEVYANVATDAAYSEKSDLEYSLAEPGNMQKSDSLSETSVSNTIFVYVCGSVYNPGVYELAENSRVYEAINAAGGMLPQANKDVINQAEYLSDGQQIYVPGSDVEIAAADIYKATAANSTNAGSGMGTATGNNASQALININTADEAQLVTIPGIGQTKASTIVAYRNENGAFLTEKDITKVSGIGDSTYEKIKDKITVK